MSLLSPPCFQHNNIYNNVRLIVSKPLMVDKMEKAGLNSEWRIATIMPKEFDLGIMCFLCFCALKVIKQEWDVCFGVSKCSTMV
jgi:hypothetical protein